MELRSLYTRGARLLLALIMVTCAAFALPQHAAAACDISGYPNLAGADLSHCYLANIDLHGADLSVANLTFTHLSFANLSGANLSGANLTITSLDAANLNGANLSGATLQVTDLTEADLSNANLSGATLTDVLMGGTNLTGANFTGATLTNTAWSTTTCPDGTNSEANGGTCEGHLLLDITPPTITCRATPSTIWSPNHKLINVTTSVSVSDTDSGPNGFTLLSVTSNEADSGLGREDQPNDIQGWNIGTADTSGQLRGERFNSKQGRTYTLTYQGADVAGNTATCTATVKVQK